MKPRFREGNRRLHVELHEREQAEDALTVAQIELDRQVQERTSELALANSALLKEIAERGRAETALRESEERYRDMFDNAQDAIYVHDLNGFYLSANRAAEELVGYTRDEIIGRNFADFMAPEDAARIRSNIGKKLEGQGLTAYEIEVRAKDGRSIPVEVSTRLIYERGIAVGVQGMAREITERKRAELERQVIAEIVQGVITTSSLDELFQLAHQAINKLLPAENCFPALQNLTSKSMHFEFWADKFDTVPAPQPIGKNCSSYVMRTGHPLLLTKERESEIYEQDGLEMSGTTVSWLGVPLRTSTRTIGALVVQDYEKEHAYSQRDLEFLATVGDQLGIAIERKQIEIELKTNEMQLTAAQQIAHIGSWEWDAIKHKLRWSDELFRIFDLQPREFAPTVKEFFAHVHRDDLDLVKGAIERALRHGAMPSFDFRILRADKTVRVLQVTVEVVADETGRNIRLW